MQPTHSLQKQLSTFLNWHPARIEVTALVILGFLQICTVNLAKIARTMGSDVDIESHRKRLKRFFAWNRMSLDDIARLIVSWVAPDEWILCLDRTCWKLGQFDINVLMIAIAYKGTAIPVIWRLLPKGGCSNMDERIKIMKRFIALFGKEKIKCLTADREFKGKKWLKWLIDNDIPYRIRIPNNTLIMRHNSKRCLKAYRYFSLQINEDMALRHARTLWGVKCYVSCHRSKKEHIVIISNEKGLTALSDYMRRWEIETLFQALKGRGFDFESTHLQDRRRIERLLGLLALTYCWALSVGEWRARRKPIKILKHGRPTHTLFRYGHELLASIVFDHTTRAYKSLLYHIEIFGKHRSEPVARGAQ